MILDDIRDTRYRDYTATMQRNLVNLLGRYLCTEWEEVPSYIAMAHPQEAQEPPQESVEDSKAHIYVIFGVKPPERG